MNSRKGGLSWWRAFGWRPGRRRPSVNTDFADMGTTFGLEASLAASSDATPSEATPGEPADARQRSAIERLNGRSVR